MSACLAIAGVRLKSSCLRASYATGQDSRILFFNSDALRPVPTPFLASSEAAESNSHRGLPHFERLNNKQLLLVLFLTRKAIVIFLNKQEQVNLIRAASWNGISVL